MKAEQFKIFNVVGARPNMMKMAPVVAVVEFLRRRQPAAQYASIDAAKSS